MRPYFYCLRVMRKRYVSVNEFAANANRPERTVRNWCHERKIAGAVLKGKTWLIPEDAKVPVVGSGSRIVFPLLKRLREEKKAKLSGGIYHRTQIDLTYNSNHIEGSKLTHDQTRHIFETETIGLANKSIKVDDILETINHFRCIDYIIDYTKHPLSEGLIKHLHLMLKGGTSDSRKEYFKVGDYKTLPNEVSGERTCAPEDVAKEMKILIRKYNALENKTLDDIIDFHYRFEKIHPFQDGNGRVGRLIMFKECLANNIVPFIITDELKLFYYRGLREWPKVQGYLRDTILTAQDEYKKLLSYFRVPLM